MAVASNNNFSAADGDHHAMVEFFPDYSGLHFASSPMKWNLLANVFCA
jgi:hypothetical protein